MTEYFLGVDAGGTKTHAAVTDGDGLIVGLGAAATGNWEHVGLAAAGQALLGAIDSALAAAGLKVSEVKSASFALAGIDWQTDAVNMAKVVAGFGFTRAPSIMNDAYAVLFAGTEDGIGCASIAGTGGKTVARDGSREQATLGMSLGEGGGASQLISETLRAIARMHHLQKPVTPLRQAVIEFTGFNDSDALFQAIARDDYRCSAEIAPLVFSLANDGDTAAIEVVTKVASAHAKDVIGIVRGLDYGNHPIQVVRAGGLHTAKSQVFDVAFNSTVAASGMPFQSRALEVVPVVGSLVHAAASAGAPLSPTARERLFNEALVRDEEFRTAIPRG